MESPLAKLGGALGTAFSLAKIGAQPDAFDALSGIGKLATDSLARSEALQEALQPPAIDYAATMPYIGPHAEITALYDVRDGVGQLQASMSAGLNAMIEVQKEQARLLSGHVELFSAERQAADARQRSTTRLIWIQLTVTTVIAVVALGAQVLLH